MVQLRTPSEIPGKSDDRDQSNLPGGTVTDCYGRNAHPDECDVACVGGLGPDRNGGICNADPNGYYNTTDQVRAKAPTH